MPVGIDSKSPKKPFSVALSVTDKIDTLVGFFGINEKPTSSKDPFALRRIALGINLKNNLINHLFLNLFYFL